jgi:Protein of unknown function (DUF2934)
MRGEGAASNNANPIIRKEEMSMSSKPKGNAEPQAISGQAAQTRAPSVGNAERDQEIRRRAYEIYLERGEQPGRELDDWLQAERELEGGVLAQAG